jgi:hypothetical protein
LIRQFAGGGGSAGEQTYVRFVEAWKRGRIIVDTGGGHASNGTPPTPPPAPPH